MPVERTPGLVLVTAPPPTPNGPLHVGHLSGPYVAGDVAARAARARGERVLTMAGLDSHQNYVLTRAETDGRPVEEVHDHFAGLIRQAFAAARVDHDIFLEPLLDADYRRGVLDLLVELVDSKAVVVEETTLLACPSCGRTQHHAYVTGRCPGCGEGAGGGTCERCGGFTTAATLLDARCGRCAQPGRPVRARVPILRLEDYRTQLTEVWAEAELPQRVVALIESLLAAGLPDVVLAYPSDWGISTGSAFGAELRMDVWVEMGLGYLYAVARSLDPDARSASQCVSAWDEVAGLWHFLGIDNAFYYAVLFPALFAAAGMPNGVLRGLVVNEFYQLDGLKFSTSRDHAIWAHELLEGTDPCQIRLYLCWDRPDRYESDFTEDGYLAFSQLVDPLLEAMRRAAPGGHSAAAELAVGPAGGSLPARPRGSLPAALAEAELARAERALRFSGFDAPLAIRCLLPALSTGSPRARLLLGVLTGAQADSASAS